jgi:hypothetical protein
MSGSIFQVDKAPLLEIPLIKTDKEKVFETLVDYILYLHETETAINEYVPNTHIIQTFEEVIDAMVMELYFKEDFEAAEIAFIKYAERDFVALSEKTVDKSAVVHAAYQQLRERNNEIRNNLMLMNIRLEHIVMPIKQG